jgi:peptidoglycan hydrolase-like protein with peptidoglycan-binding domain
MTLLKDVTDCSTYSVRGLDDQLIAQMNRISPGLLVRIDDINNVKLADAAVHPWMQPAAKIRLQKAVAARGKQIIINSALRTLAGQMLLYQHFQNRRCGITAAATPGQSNHNNASAIDIEDSQGWRPVLQANGWRWIGSFDPMHYDCIGPGITSINLISVKAFQQLWSIVNPKDKLAADGLFGPATASRLRFSPAEGFPGVEPARILKLTQPVQAGRDVGDLQLALRKAGIKLDKADMIFGPSTDQAVKEFQAANSLVADGIVGPITRQIIFAYTPGGKEPSPIKVPSNPPINLAEIFSTYQAQGLFTTQQQAELKWLQSQIPQATLEQFTKLWRGGS